MLKLKIDCWWEQFTGNFRPTTPLIALESDQQHTAPKKVSLTRFMCWCIDSIELNHPRTLSSRVGRLIYFSTADSFVCLLAQASLAVTFAAQLEKCTSDEFGFSLKFAHELLDHSSNSIISDKLLIKFSFFADFSRWENFRERIALVSLSTLNRRRNECLKKW